MSEPSPVPGLESVVVVVVVVPVPDPDAPVPAPPVPVFGPSLVTPPGGRLLPDPSEELLVRSEDDPVAPVPGRVPLDDPPMEDVVVAVPVFLAGKRPSDSSEQELANRNATAQKLSAFRIGRNVSHRWHPVFLDNLVRLLGRNVEKTLDRLAAAKVVFCRPAQRLP